ncbi:cytochrome c oxidase, subunit VIb [Gorgonomyces haynaldii]|nr:cytochrome c oxidase, subunit VIb [Gorgonomyces haynaldii]
MSEEAVDYPQLKTVGFDARFPNTNQTKNCWQNYVDYWKCVSSKGEDFQPCQQFQSAYRSLCPPAWLDRWNEQREAGVFPALAEKKEAHH